MMLMAYAMPELAGTKDREEAVKRSRETVKDLGIKKVVDDKLKDVNTTEEYAQKLKDDNIFALGGLGLAESVFPMASPKMTGFFTTAVDDAYGEIEEVDPDASVEIKALYGATQGAIVLAAEKLGFKHLVGNKSILKGLTGKVLKHAKKLEGFLDKNTITRTVGNLINGFFAEGESGLAEFMGQDAVKEIYNWLKGEDIIETKKGSDYVHSAIESFVAEGIGGVIMKGGMSPFQPGKAPITPSSIAEKVKNNETLTNEEFEGLRETDTETEMEAVENNLQAEVDAGRMTSEEAVEARDNLVTAVETAKKVTDNVPEGKRAEAFNLVSKKNNIQNEIKKAEEADDILAGPMKAKLEGELAEVNAQLEEIVSAEDAIDEDVNKKIESVEDDLSRIDGQIAEAEKEGKDKTAQFLRESKERKETELEEALEEREAIFEEAGFGGFELEGSLEENIGEEVNYGGIEGTLAKDAEGDFVIVSTDGDSYMIEGGLTGASPTELGVIGIEVDEKTIDEINEDEGPVEADRVAYDPESGKLSLYGKEYAYDSVETDDAGNTTAVKVIDENGDTKFIRNADAVLEVEIQQEIWESERRGETSEEALEKAMEEEQVKPKKDAKRKTKAKKSRKKKAGKPKQKGPVEGTEKPKRKKAKIKPKVKKKPVAEKPKITTKEELEAHRKGEPIAKEAKPKKDKLTEEVEAEAEAALAEAEKKKAEKPKTVIKQYKNATDEAYGYVQEPGGTKKNLTKEQFEAQMSKIFAPPKKEGEGKKQKFKKARTKADVESDARVKKVKTKEKDGEISYEATLNPGYQSGSKAKRTVKAKTLGGLAKALNEDVTEWKDDPKRESEVAKEELKGAWKRAVDVSTKVGVAFDPKSVAEADIALVKAVKKYVAAKIKEGAYDLKTFLADMKSQGIKGKEEDFKEIFDEAEAKSTPPAKAVPTPAPPSHTTSVDEVTESNMDAETEADIEAVVGDKSFATIMTDLKDSIVRTFKDQFRSRGLLPKEIFKRKIKMEGQTAKALKDMDITIKKFKAAVKESYGEPSKTDMAKIDMVLKGDADISTLPDQMHDIVIDMREQIDELSRRMVDEGIVEGDLAATVQDNMGVYMTRSYKIHDDPTWASKVPERIRNKAKAYIGEQYEKNAKKMKENAEKLRGRDQDAEVSALEARIKNLESSKKPKDIDRAKKLKDDLERLKARDFKAEADDMDAKAEFYGNEDIDAVIDAMLYTEDSPMAILKGSSLGAKDIGILTKRKDIPAPIRALLGEHTGPMVNYAKSMVKMANLIESQKFLNDVKVMGMGKFFFKKPTGDNIVKLSAEESNAMSPLNGLYTTPDIKQAFEDFGSNTEASGVLFKAYMAANGFVKYGKTVGSPMTHVRNFVSNTNFAIANGHFLRGDMADAIRVALNEAKTGDKVGFRERYKRYLELGIVSESTNMGELRDLIKDATGKDTTFESLTDSRITKLKGKAEKVLESAYQAEDDVWKIYAFESEKKRYGKAFPSMSEADLEQKAADIIRQTYPTYSLTPKIVKGLRRFPLAGTFVSFPAEVIRTSYNTVSLARSEMKDSNPDVKAIGRQRAAGILTATFITGGISMATKAFVGMGDDEEEALRRFTAPWSSNSQYLVYSYDKNGNVGFIDMGFSDPYAYLKKPIIRALMDDDGRDNGFMEAIGEMLSPFLGEEILAGKIREAVSNKKSTGQEIYNEESDWDTKLAKSFEHVSGALEPGAVSQFRRIWKGIWGEENVYGKKYDPVVEIGAVVSGQRATDLDITQAYSFKSYNSNKEISSAKRIYSSVANRRGSVTNEEKEDSYAEANGALRSIVMEAHKDYKAAQLLGVNSSKLRRMLKDLKMPEKYRKMIRSGNYKDLEKIK
jgi:hypothetical protein